MTDGNDFSMPFLMPTHKAAWAIVKAIKNKKKYAIIPWQINFIGKIMYLLPISIWDWLAKKAPRKKTAPL